jgi:hypothetical protein
MQCFSLTPLALRCRLTLTLTLITYGTRPRNEPQGLRAFNYVPFFFRFVDKSPHQPLYHSGNPKSLVETALLYYSFSLLQLLLEKSPFISLLPLSH